MCVLLCLRNSTLALVHKYIQHIFYIKEEKAFGFHALAFNFSITDFVCIRDKGAFSFPYRKSIVSAPIMRVLPFS